MARRDRNKAEGNLLAANDVSVLCRQFNLLVRAGVPIYDGLSSMLEDTDSSREKEMFTALRDKLVDNMPLSRALNETGMFPDYAVRMIEVGESTGSLEGILVGLADYYQREHAIKRALREALSYPLAMAVIMLAVLFLLTGFVMPVFEGVLEQLGAQFTPFAAGVINAVKVISGICLGLVIIAAAGAIAARFFGGQAALSAFLKRFTSNSRLSRLIDTNRFASLLALSLDSGLTLSDCLEMCEPLMESRDARQKIEVLRQCQQDSISLSESLAKAEFFSATNRRMIQVGVDAGALSDALGEVSNEYASLIDDKIASSIARIEPIMVSAMSLIAGGILLLVMLPLISILSSIG